MTCANRCCALALGLLVALALPVWAQTQVTDTAPIKIKAPKPKKETFKGEVLVFTRVSITVRSRDNANLVRTFTYNDKMAAKMAKYVDENKPYQYSDRVEIKVIAGSDQAIKIKGKRGQNRQ